MADFEIAYKIVHKNEGKYTNNPKDRGNRNSRGMLVGTNYGISAPIYEKWIKRPPTVADMKAITADEAKEILYKWFWLPSKAGSINDQQVANIYYDFFVNTPPAVAIRAIQTAANTTLNRNILVIDGKIGAKTIAAINISNGETIFNIIKKLRLQHYNRLVANDASQLDFIKGWINRTNKFIYQKKKEDC